jgi:hypothetical protein
MAFQGSLKELPLPDIIQLIAVSGKTGVFSVEDDRTVGRIFLDEGQLVHAEVGGIRGEEAVYELSIWPEGDFEFLPDESGGATVTIEKSNEGLLLEAARRTDEWTILSKRIGSTRMIPVFTSMGAQGASFNPGESAVVGMIDERRSLEEIALALARSPFEVAKIAFGLLASRIIELREHASLLDPEHLASLPQERLDALAASVYREATGKLSGDDSQERLNTLHSAIRNLDDREGRAKAVISMIRSAHQLLLTDRGPDEASNFYDRVEELIVEL